MTGHNTGAKRPGELVVGTLPVPEPVLQGERKDSAAAWGVLIHRLLEHAMRDPGRDRTHFEKLARWFVFDHPELADFTGLAVDTLFQVMDTDFWKDALQAGERPVEVPFGVKVVDGELVFGVLDLALRREQGWDLVDYKTGPYEVDDLLGHYAEPGGAICSALD